MVEMWTFNLLTKDMLQGYDTVSHDPEDYEGKKVLILGKGTFLLDDYTNQVGVVYPYPE